MKTKLGTMHLIGSNVKSTEAGRELATGYRESHITHIKIAPLSISFEEINILRVIDGLTNKLT